VIKRWDEGIKTMDKCENALFICLAALSVLFKVSFFLSFQNLMGWSSVWKRVSLMFPKFEFHSYHVTGFSLQVTII